MEAAATSHTSLLSSSVTLARTESRPSGPMTSVNLTAIKGCSTCIYWHSSHKQARHVGCAGHTAAQPAWLGPLVVLAKSCSVDEPEVLAELAAAGVASCWVAVVAVGVGAAVASPAAVKAVAGVACRWAPVAMQQ